MSHTIVNKHTRVFMLLTFLFLLPNLMTAQLSKVISFIPLSMDSISPKLDSTYSISEFNSIVASDISPVLLTVADTLTADSASLSRPIAADTTTSIAQNSDTSKTKTLVAENIAETTFFQDSTCVDLMIDSVSIVNITEKYIEIEYSIINKGTAPAPIFGKKRSNTDNVAIHFYFSGTPRLTRGSILAEGIYLTEGLRETKGMLAPNMVYKNKFKLSLEKKNRFYGVIILQLDAFDVMRHECDETNNVFSIVPKWY